MLLVFAFTLFFSATLLFLVQPLVGKLILPYLGGTPAVWNTCMVFFQALLLAGYAYAHALSRWFSMRSQLVVHAIVLLTPLIPLSLLCFDVGWVAQNWPPEGNANPIPWLLTVLLVTAGLPFFVVSTSAPLMQNWFAGTDHPAARDPYFLYAASNVGSMLALLCYPSVIEPYLRLANQRVLWALAYAGLAVMILVCGLLAARAAQRKGVQPLPSTEAKERDVPTSHPTMWRRLRWILLAFVPSSLMLGVTTHITTDIAAIPLLWILPLALYLLSFILVFSRIPFLAQAIHGCMLLLLPVVVLALTFEYVLIAHYDLRNFEKILLHLAGLFVIAMVCHGELARTRPSTAYLTEFFLLMSLGGVLGGMFNALVAPNLFNRVWEYPLIIAVACLLMPRFGAEATDSPWLRWPDWIFAAGLGLFGILAGGMLFLRAFVSLEEAHVYVNKYLPSSLQRPGRFLVGNLCESQADVIVRERNFFGYFSVVQFWYHQDKLHERYHKMFHGTTTHGMQCLEPPERRLEPLTYFHRTGPIGQLFDVIEARKKPQNVAVLGVGTGTLAAYMRRGWDLTLYEIDPVVVRVARDTNFFTYIPDAEKGGVHVKVILGDGRLQFQKAPDSFYDMIFMDAFTSDAVPVHLITREAVQMYLTKLKPDGVLVINIANRYLGFNPVLGNLAKDLSLEGWMSAGEEDRTIDRYATAWVVMARNQQALGDLLEKTVVEEPALPDVDVEAHAKVPPSKEPVAGGPALLDLIGTVGLMGSPFGQGPLLAGSALFPRRAGQRCWVPLRTDPRLGVWTDDYSNLLSVFRWEN
jgi:SAM-dependent methyltransferase